MEAQTPLRLLGTAIFFSVAIQWAAVAPAENRPRQPSTRSQGGFYFSQRGAYEDAIYGARRGYRAVERLATSRSNPFRLGVVPSRTRRK